MLSKKQEKSTEILNLYMWLIFYHGFFYNRTSDNKEEKVSKSKHTVCDSGLS